MDKSPDQKTKTKTFLIGKELKTKDLRKTAANRASGPTTKPESKPPDSLRREASQAAGAAPTLRYGPAGDKPVDGVAAAQRIPPKSSPPTPTHTSHATR